MLTRYLPAISVAVVVMLIVAVSVWTFREEVGLSSSASAQEGPSDYVHLFQDAPGDNDIVALIGANSEEVITQGDLRLMAKANIVHQPGVSMDEMINKVIVSRVASAIVYAEAKRLGHEPSDEDLEIYMQSIKDACESSEGRLCRKMIREQGYSDLKEYWRDAKVGYRRGMALTNLRESYLDRLYPNGASEEQEDKAWAAYEKSLRNSVDVEWRDDRMKAVYEQALFDESIFVPPVSRD